MNLPFDTIISSSACFAVPVGDSAVWPGGRRPKDWDTASITEPFEEADFAAQTRSDKLTIRAHLGGHSITERTEPRKNFIEVLLADPMVRLFMQADGYSDAEMRGLYFGGATVTQRTTLPRRPIKDSTSDPKSLPGPRPGSPRPGIGE